MTDDVIPDFYNKNINIAKKQGKIATFGLGFRIEIVKRNGFSGYKVVEGRDHLYSMLNK